jgi:uncharacterized protein (TIRG00374 family)
MVNWKNYFVGFFLVIGLVVTAIIVNNFGLLNIINFYKNFKISTLIYYFLTIFVLYIVLTWRWDVILRSRGHKISFHKLFIYRVIGNAINFFTPGPRVGGEPTQASLLGRHKVEFTEGLSTVMIDKIIDVSTCGVLFIIGAILVSFQYVIPKNAEIYMIVGGALFLGLTILFYYRMLNSKHFFLKIFHFFRLDKSKNKTIQKIEAGITKIELIMIQFYKHDKKTFILSLIITLLSWIIMFAEYKLATSLLGLDLGFVQLFFIITFIGLALLFPIPMAVGVLEAGQISAFSVIKVSGGAGVALAGLVRIKDLFWGLIGLLLLAKYGFNVPKTIEQKYRPSSQVNKFN